MNQSERDDFVAALLTGGLSLDDPQVQARLREQPEVRIMYERLRATEDDVEQLAAEAREMMAEARAGGAPEHADRVIAGVKLAASEFHRKRFARRLVAAAAVLMGLALGWYFLARTPPQRDDFTLGSDPRLDPKGVVTTYSPFTWKKVDRPEGGRFVLSIYGMVDGKRTLLFRPEVENVTSPWHLPPETEATLPNEIWWTLEVIGDVTERLDAHARRQ